MGESEDKLNKASIRAKSKDRERYEEGRKDNVL